MTINYDKEVCIVGLGPAGIGTALTLSDSDLAQDVICLDAGGFIDTRYHLMFLDHNSISDIAPHIIKGVGGCSLLGGGKLSMLPAGGEFLVILNSPQVAETKMLEAFHILNSYIPLAKPRFTTTDIDYAYQLFLKLGFEFRYYDAYLFNHKDIYNGYMKIFARLYSKRIQMLTDTLVTQISPYKNGFKLTAFNDKQEIIISTRKLVLGVGRLGRKFLRSLNTQLDLGGVENTLDVGVRLEFPTNIFPEIDKYHNDLKLSFGKSRTFCVCRDGKIAQYFYENACFSEGYRDYRDKTGFSNLAILVRLEPSPQNESIFNDIKENFNRISEKRLMCQKLPNFLDLDSRAQTPIQSSISNFKQGNIKEGYPESIYLDIKEAVSYFVSRLIPEEHWDEINVFAPEVSSPDLRFPIKKDFSITPDLYLIGEGSGRFHGILQSFCSGIICGESITGIVLSPPTEN